MSAPAKSLAFCTFDSAGINLSFLQNVLVFGGKVIADDGNNANICEVARGQGEESTGTTKNIVYSSRRRGNSVKGNRTYGKDAHYEVLGSRYLSRMSCSFLQVSLGILSRSVRIAWASAEPHLHPRFAGIEATVWRTTWHAFSAFFSNTATI